MQKFQKEKKGCINHLINEQKGENLCYVMLCEIYFYVGSLQICNDSTTASLEANQNRPVKNTSYE